MLKFIEQNHQYLSLNDSEQINWIGVTTLVGALHEKFNESTAESCSVRKPTKTRPNIWYGIPPEEIKQAWINERDRASELGSWYHLKREQAFLSKSNVVPIYNSIYDELGHKLAPNQVLKPGIYPEHFVYLKSAGITGQADYVEVVDNNGLVLNIRDYKTSKEIKRRSYVNWEGVSKKMFDPIKHLDDCHFYHYALQLSIYMYIILRHNPNIKPGSLIIEHIKFEIEDKDKYGYPIYKKQLNEQGVNEFVVAEIEEIKLPYLQTEVKDIIEWLKTNRNSIQKKK